MVGIFNSTADFNPGSGVYNLTSAGAQDVYVVKLDDAGNFKWAARVGGSMQDFAYSIAVSEEGFVYIAGNFRGTADFNPGLDVFNLTSAGGSDIFILKLDTSSNFIWAKAIGSAGDDNAEKFTLDHSGNLVICGAFSGTVDFDVSSSIHNLTSIGATDVYILKWNGDGNYVWAGRFGSTSGEIISAISVDSENDIYATGEFYGTVDFDPGTSTYNLNTTGFNGNIFVLKWNSAGNFDWADNMGNSSGGDQGTGIKVDPNGAVIVTGSYFGIVDFDPGTGIYNLTSTGNNGDIFILKLNSADGTFLFAKSLGGSTLDQPYALSLNDAGNIFISGLFSGTADFDPGLSVFNLISSGPSDAFIVELDNEGSFIWAYGFGGFQDDFSRGINIYNSNMVYVSGVFTFTADFDPGTSSYNISSFSNSGDAFLLKLGFCTPLQTELNFNLCPGDSIHAGGAYQHIPGTYYDYYASLSGCDSIVITVLQNTFTLELGNDIEACNSDVVSLDANVGGAIYYWSTGDTSQVIEITAGGFYTVQVTKDNCTQEDTVNVVFHEKPSVNLGADTSFCQGGFIILHSGNPGSIHQWSTGATSQNIVANTTGTYSVKVINSFGCAAKDTINVIVHPTPNVDLGNDTSICEDQVLLLDAGNPLAMHEWTTGATSQSIVADTNGIYGVTVTNLYGCSSGDSIVLDILPTPNVNLGNDTAVCHGESLLLDAGNEGADHLWNTGEGSQSIIVNSQGTYSVIVTNTAGCSAFDTISVVVHALPFVSLGNDTAICTDAQVTLDAGPSFLNYQWQDGSSNEMFTLDGSSGEGIYELSVLVTDSNGCINGDTILVTVDICTGIKSSGAQSILIYPNPANDFISIKSNEVIRCLTLYNTAGEIVYQELPSTASCTAKLPVAAYSEGIYILKVVGNFSMMTRMISVQH